MPRRRSQGRSNGRARWPLFVGLAVVAVLAAANLAVLLRDSTGEQAAPSTTENPDAEGEAGSEGTAVPTASTLATAGGGAAIPIGGCLGTQLQPGDDLAAKVGSRPPGSTFCFAPGRYEEATIVPRAGDRFEGTPETILSGSRELTQWAREGNAWVAASEFPERGPHGICRPDTPLCSEPARVFLDDTLLAPVGSPAAVRPGSYHVDRANGRVYLGEDPTGRRVELTLRAHAFASGDPDVTIIGLAMQRYATSAQEGAIQAFDGASGWTIDGVTVRESSGGGIGARNHDRFVLRDSVIENNGQIGVSVSGRDVLVEHNRIAGNNTAGFAETWEAGGAKFTTTRNLMVRGNVALRNGGPGLWTDIDNVDATFEANVADENLDSGIFHEVSYAATITNNVARSNGFGIGDRWCYGAGILVSASSDTTVVGNTVIDNHRGIVGIQQARGAGPLGTYIVVNLQVQGNRVVSSRPDGITGICDDTTGVVYGPVGRNQFSGNRYEGPGTVFQWAGSPTQDFATWQAVGQDRDGSFQAAVGEALDPAAAAVVAAAGPRPS